MWGTRRAATHGRWPATRGGAMPWQSLDPGGLHWSPTTVANGVLYTMGPAVFVMTDGKLYTATITMTVNFLAPAKPGPITGEANVTQLGKTIAFVEGRLMAANGAVLATATSSARLVESAKAIR